MTSLATLNSSGSTKNLYALAKLLKQLRVPNLCDALPAKPLVQLTPDFAP